MIKIVHIITGLNRGGAEMMLYKLLKNIDKTKYELEVISIMDKGFFGDEIEKLGIRVHTLNMERGIFSLKGIYNAIKICDKANIIQTWMYHSNLLGYIISKIVKPYRLIWGIHHSNLEFRNNKKTTLLIVKICALLSKTVDVIVYCSFSSLNIHKNWGYNAKQFMVITNGFDTNIFSKKSQVSKIRKSFDISENKKIILNVGRWDILKDYNNLIQALSILKKRRDDIVCLICGTNLNKNNCDMLDLQRKYEVDDKIVHLLGVRDDISQLMSEVDIYVSSSKGEGFPNVVGEAMSCQLPCVVTDVGDCGYIVGDTGIVVERENPEKLAEGIEKLLLFSKGEMNKLGKKARERIINNFNIKIIATKYEELYRLN